MRKVVLIAVIVAALLYVWEFTGPDSFRLHSFIERARHGQVFAPATDWDHDR
jgi:hypothetical protein